MTDHDIALDVHSTFSEVAVVTTSGRLTRRERCLTTIPELVGVIGRFRALPGIDWIRAVTFYVYVDTPWRFKKKASLWKYLGIGLERRHSGTGPTQVRVSKRCNRMLKAMILGAAQSAIQQGDNKYYDQYLSWIEGGQSTRNARRNVARSMAATLWGMWKSGSAYRAELVRAAKAKGGSVLQEEGRLSGGGDPSDSMSLARKIRSQPRQTDPTADERRAAKRDQRSQARGLGALDAPQEARKREKRPASGMRLDFLLPIGAVTRRSRASAWARGEHAHPTLRVVRACHPTRDASSLTMEAL